MMTCIYYSLYYFTEYFRFPGNPLCPAYSSLPCPFLWFLCVPPIIVFLFCVQAVWTLLCNNESLGRIYEGCDLSKEKDVTAPPSVTISKERPAY